jgi:hypothetical protein
MNLNWIFESVLAQIEHRKLNFKKAEELIDKVKCDGFLRFADKCGGYLTYKEDEDGREIIDIVLQFGVVIIKQ